jgi:hypothetical protein
MQVFHSSPSVFITEKNDGKKMTLFGFPITIPMNHDPSLSCIIGFDSVPNVSFEALNLILPSVNIVESRWAMRLLEIILIIFGVPLGNLT